MSIPLSDRDRLFTIKEVTELLSISRFVLRRLIKEKRIRACYIGHKRSAIRFTGQALEESFELNRVKNIS